MWMRLRTTCLANTPGLEQVGSIAPPLIAAVVTAMDDAQGLRFMLFLGVMVSYLSAAFCFAMCGRAAVKETAAQAMTVPTGGDMPQEKA